MGNKVLTSDEAKIDVEGKEIAVGIQPHFKKAMEQMITLGRAGTPEEAADAVNNNRAIAWGNRIAPRSDVEARAFQHLADGKPLVDSRTVHK